MSSSRLLTLFPHLRAFRVDAARVATDGITLDLQARRRSARCPLCGARAMRVQSTYLRTMRDLPCGGLPLILRMRVRRFLCTRDTCARRIFAEQFPDLAAPRARRFAIFRHLPTLLISCVRTVDKTNRSQAVMATLRGIDFGVDDARFHAGAAFRLSETPRNENIFTTTSGDEVVIYPDCPCVIVRLTHAPSASEQLGETYEIALRAMDVLAIQGLDSITLPNGHREHFLWWRQDGVATLRYTDRVAMRVRVSGELSVTRADGTPEPNIPAPRPGWHPSFRYFRLSQATDDLYESYRHMYLALEAVLSSLVPKQKNEGEKAWLKRALVSIPGGFDLSPYVDPGVTDPVDNFVQTQFIAHRNALLHAKVGISFLPGSFEQRAQVATALGCLAGIVTALCQQHLAARRNSGGFSERVLEMLRSARHRPQKVEKPRCRAQGCAWKMPS